MENEFDNQNDLDSNIIEIPDDEFDAAFSKSPTADNLKGGKKSTDTEEEEEEEEIEEEKVAKPAAKKAPAKAAEKKVEKTNEQTSDEEIVDVPDDELENETPKKKTKTEKTENTEPDDEYDPEAPEVRAIKAHVDYLIDNKIWAEFEGREDVQWTDEVFAQVTEQQDQHRIQQAVAAELENTGYYGQSIMTYIRNGGNPEKLIDIFKTQQAIKEFDLTTDDGKKEQIRMYYSDVLNWDKARIDKHITRLEVDEELDEESKHIDSHYSKQVKQTVEQEQKLQAKRKKEADDAQATFTASVSDVMTKRKDLDDTEKKRLLAQYTQYKQVEGGQVNQMYLNFQEVQSNPESFVLLLEFLDNPKKFIKKEQAKAVKEDNVKKLKFFQANSTDNKTKSQAKVTRKSSGDDFSGWS
jgi:hypothetical protein